MTQVLVKQTGEYAIYVNNEKILQNNFSDVTYNDIIKQLNIGNNVVVLQATEFPKTISDTFSTDTQDIEKTILAIDKELNYDSTEKYAHLFSEPTIDVPDQLCVGDVVYVDDTVGIFSTIKGGLAIVQSVQGSLFKVDFSDNVVYDWNVLKHMQDQLKQKYSDTDYAVQY